MHYYFFVDVNNGVYTKVYKCVIDFKDYNIYNPPYRIINLDSDNEIYYNGIFDNQSDSWHDIWADNLGKNKEGGGLDYLRHPGLPKISLTEV